MSSKFFTTEHTRYLAQVIREIETDPATYRGAKYMPAYDFPATEVFWDIWEASGGTTQESTLGTDPKSVAKKGFRTAQYEPGTYKEFIRFNEKDILKLRALGQNDQSQRGIRQHLNKAALKLNNRIEARMELLRWQSILNGTFTFDGKVVDFQKPVNHDVAPVTPWGSVIGGVLTANPASTPVEDLRLWLMGGYAAFRKYNITKIVMNKNTARIILDNPNVQSLIQSRFAAETYPVHDINQVMGFLIPGCPPIDVYGGWYQQETPDATTGQISVGDAIFFLDDGRVFFECNLPDGDPIGDVAMTLNLANGSVDSPAPGKFIIVDEHIEDHPGNPYIDIFGGFYGGPRLMRPFDVLTATVV